ncbi:Saccharopine dehydrogenase-domain-containing protein [Xylariaceae sp. AK1471]|nr:Saccharopine dehydrogenase-domain-containing protein [Xylariaceae sp. AK1471]
MPELLIYGATGYTGSLASQYANSLAFDFSIAGRTEDKLKNLATSLEVPYQVFDVEDNRRVDSALTDVRVLLNCAGPFIHTAGPLADACIRNGVHYLDVSAELESYKLMEERDKAAIEANVMLLPGCGGSVAMLGCLVGHVIERMQDPISIEVALCVSGPVSRGTAVTMVSGATTGCLRRVDGKLVEQDVANTIEFDFDNGEGPVGCFPVTLPDLITIWKSTNVENITTFAYASGSSFPASDLDLLPNGPTAEEREANPYHAAVKVVGKDGPIMRAVLHTANGYTFTHIASVEAARRILLGEARKGFQVPVAVFGNMDCRDSAIYRIPI